ncbi:MAG: hypothetical protein [Microviridae sp.]|nr:MAG: hypothetical protein [Microviridae sp.]
MKEQESILNDQNGNSLTEGKNEKLFERIHVKGTPFEIVKTENECFIALGKYRISDNKTEQQHRDDIYDLDYTFLINVIFAVVDMTDKMKHETAIYGNYHLDSIEKNNPTNIKQ